MPLRRRNRRLQRRRKKPRKMIRYRQVVGMPLPSTLYSRMRYSDNITISNSGAFAAGYTFRATSLYDPDFSGIGHQPRGFDQIMPLYDHFTVIGSKMQVRFYNLQNNATQVLVATSGNDSNPSTFINGIEWSGRKTAILGSGITNSGNPEAALTQNYSYKKTLGLKNWQDENSLRGDNANNPQENAFFHILVQSLDETTNLSNGVRAQVVIDYYVAFTEPKNPSES